MYLSVGGLLSVQDIKWVSLTLISTAYNLKRLWRVLQCEMQHEVRGQNPSILEVKDLWFTILIRVDINYCRWVNTLTEGDRGGKKLGFRLACLRNQTERRRRRGRRDMKRRSDDRDGEGVRERGMPDVQSLVQSLGRAWSSLTNLMWWGRRMSVSAVFPSHLIQ